MPLDREPWWRAQSPRLTGRSGDELQRLFDSPGIDVVVIASSMPATGLAAEALRAGKSVVAEYSALAHDSAESALLDAARRQGGGQYHLFRPDLFDGSVRIVKAMADRGAFGDLTYGSAGNGSAYRRPVPLLGLSHVCHWMRINQDDRIVRLSARSDEDSPLTLLRTARGRLIELRNPSRAAAAAIPDDADPRYHTLHGTRGSYRRTPDGERVYLHGRTTDVLWEPLKKYAREFVPDAFGTRSEAHLAIDDLARVLRGGVGVSANDSLVDSVMWSEIDSLVHGSIRGDGTPTDVPRIAFA
jgi:predicted dehydrogenase